MELRLDILNEKCDSRAEVKLMRDRAGSQNNQIKIKTGIMTPEWRKAVLWRPAPPVIVPVVVLGD